MSAVAENPLVETPNGANPIRLLKKGDRVITLKPSEKLKEAIKLKNGQAERADEILFNTVLDLVRRVEELELKTA